MLLAWYADAVRHEPIASSACAYGMARYRHGGCTCSRGCARGPILFPQILGQLLLCLGMLRCLLGLFLYPLLQHTDTALRQQDVLAALPRCRYVPFSGWRDL